MALPGLSKERGAAEVSDPEDEGTPGGGRYGKRRRDCRVNQSEDQGGGGEESSAGICYSQGVKVFIMSFDTSPDLPDATHRHKYP